MSGWRRLLWPIVVLIGGSLGLFLLWHALFAVLGNDRGLDITDEGLYLLAADPPTSRSAWQFPWGWHTRPLFGAVGYDIGAFRTLGAILLVLASAWLGWAAVKLAVDIRNRRCRDNSKHQGLAAGGALTGGVGSLLYYAGLLRTPSYNWVNLFGITLAATGQILVIGWLRTPRGRSGVAGLVVLVSTTAFGTFCTIPAKPSSAIFLLISGCVLMGIMMGLGPALKWTAAIAAGTTGWVVLAVLTGVWPRDFLSVFRRGLEFPALVRPQTPVGAIKSLLKTPTYLVQPVFSALGLRQTELRSTVVLIVAIAVAGVAINYLSDTTVPSNRRKLLQRALGTVGVVTALRLAAVPFPFVHDEVHDRWIFTPLVTACLLLVGVAVVLSLDVDGSGERRPQGPGGDGSWHSFALLVYVLLLPFAFGFGSSHETYPQASLGAGILLVAVMTAYALGDSRATSARFGFAIVLITFAMTATTLYEGHKRPYRIAPLASQDVPVAVGTRQRILRLDRDLADVLRSLDSQARAASWTRGTPIVGLEWRWSSTVPYFLGATVPDSLMLTLSGSLPIAEHNLADPQSRFAWGKAWVLSTPADLLNEVLLNQLGLVARAVQTRSGLSFPDDYVCVAHAGNIELWRPDPEEPSAIATKNRPRMRNDCPPASPQSSAYDASNGWVRE